MEKFKVDIFKGVLIALLIWIAFSIHGLSNKGRYQFSNSTIEIIIDTKTGKIFKLVIKDDGNWESVEVIKKLK